MNYLLIISPAGFVSAVRSGVAVLDAAEWPGFSAIPVVPSTLAALELHRLPSGQLPDPRTVAVLTWNDIRLARQPMMDASDWTQTADQTDVRKAAWAAYRAILKGLPDVPGGNPNAVTWPKLPTV